MNWQLLVGSGLSNVSVGTVDGEPTTVSWTDGDEHSPATYKVTYQMGDDGTSSRIDVEVFVCREGGLESALNTIHDVLVRQGFDQMSGELNVSMENHGGI